MTLYTVTYCTMDQDVGANPFWHTCILLSKLDSETKKLEVLENWGFYGLPTTMGTSIIRNLKISLGLDVDLFGNHGMLRHEEMRHLDAGSGLHGVTFELTEEKFKALQAKCKKFHDDQYRAIHGVTSNINLNGKPDGKYRIYAQEQHSRQIFDLVKAAAKENGKQPELKPFELFGGNTCKTVAIDLLRGIVTPQQIKRITGMAGSVSRFSGTQETIFLHSTGPTRQHVKKSGDVLHYRKVNDEGVRLYWSLPPQEFELINAKTEKLFKEHPEHAYEAKTVISKLQKLEWQVMNASVPAHYALVKEQLLKEIRSSYEAFSHIEHTRYVPHESTWTNTGLSLLGLPRNQQEAQILQHINQGKGLLNSIYFAIVDNAWLPKRVDSTMIDENKVDAVAVANYFKDSDQEKICKVLGRSYAAKWSSEEDSSSLSETEEEQAGPQLALVANK